MNEAAPDTMEAVRIKRFASFFKSYMSVSTIVAAALPIPITSLKVIPAFESQRGALATYTPLVCFLLLSYVFYLRHAIGAALFSRRAKVSRTRSAVVNTLPALLIAGCLLSIWSYNFLLNESIQKLKVDFAAEAHIRSEPDAGPDDAYNVLPDGTVTFSGKWLLENVAFDKVYNGSSLIFVYILIFATAEAAFVLMALREYIQDVLKLEDAELIAGAGAVARPSES